MVAQQTDNQEGVRTHKEQDRHFDGFVHEYDPSEVPRDPTAYKLFDHFLEGLQDPEARLEQVPRMLREGRIYPAEGNNRYRFLWTAPDLRTYALFVELQDSEAGQEGRHEDTCTPWRRDSSRSRIADWGC
jgi:hypothetical protein